MIEPVIQARLYDQIADLVSTRIVAHNAEPGTALPHVVYTISSIQSEYDLGAPLTLYHYGVDVECFAETVSGAAELAAAVRTALDGWQDYPAVQNSRLQDGYAGTTDTGFGWSLSFEVTATV